MTDRKLISICIPAYKRIDFLQRLLKSIAVQEFRDFEVVVTDDSPDENVQILCTEYSSKFLLFYYRNEQPLGTPENWNEALRKANGQWIKLMHDDDWFSDQYSLKNFADETARNPDASFFFSAYTNLYEDGRTENVFPSHYRMRSLQKHPTTLISKNIIGPPSVSLTKNDQRLVYDKNLKWLVDIDYYIRYLSKAQSVFINKTLVNVGLGSHQVTVDCVRQRPVEIPENFYLLNKMGVRSLRNIWIYDAWWRLMRNLEITNESEIRMSGFPGEIPLVIRSMISWQKKIPRRLLKMGLFSKCCMSVHCMLNRMHIR